MDRGEGEGDEDAGEAASKSKRHNLQRQTSSLNGISIGGLKRQATTVGDQGHGGLYKPDNLHESNDKLQGVTPIHYANVSKNNERTLADTAYAQSDIFAVIAFWDLDNADDQFKCKRFFIVPNPM